MLIAYPYTNIAYPLDCLPYIYLNYFRAFTHTVSSYVVAS